MDRESKFLGILAVAAGLALFALATSGCSDEGGGVAIGESFGTVKTGVEPSVIGPGQRTVVKVDFNQIIGSPDIDALDLDVEFDPVLVPVENEVTVTVDGNPFKDFTVTRKTEGGDNILEVKTTRKIEDIDEDVEIRVPFQIDPTHPVTVAQQVDFGVDLDLNDTAVMKAERLTVRVLPSLEVPGDAGPPPDAGGGDTGSTVR